AASKDALLDGLVEALYLELEERLGTDPAFGPEADGTTVRERLHRIARATYDVCLDHPRAVPLLATRMLAVPLARRPLAVLRNHERVPPPLRESGLDDPRATTGLRAPTASLPGYVAAQVQPVPDARDGPHPAFRLGLHRMPVQELPRLRETATALAERGGPEGLTAGLDALLDRFA